MITRFAPSPTGLLHLGHAFAALRAWEEAQQGLGTFVLRLEDIDAGRSRPHFEEAIFEDLTWLGLAWPRPVWRQSQRMAAYSDALEKLERLGVIYACFCTRQEISLAAPHGSEGSIYTGTCRRMSCDERAALIAEGRPYALRLNVEKANRLTGPLTWIDLDAGVIEALPHQLGDVVLARKDIATSYHLAVTVDDAAQQITVVTRGEDLFASTHIHRLLQALLGLSVPVWRHHRLICDKDGKRLAKRDDSHSLRLLREGGFTPTDVRRMLSKF